MAEIIRNRPFITQTGLRKKWVFVVSWRETNGVREAVVKHDIDEAIRQIILDHGGNLNG